MGNKKKRSKETTNEQHSSGSDHLEASVSPNNIQPADSVKIKQESDIKQEPESVSTFVEIPASTYRNAIHISANNARAVENDVDYWILNEVKDEIMEECGDKKVEEPKMNADSVDQQPRSQAKNGLQQPQRNHDARNTQKSGNNSDGYAFKKHKCKDCNYSTKYALDLKRHLLKHTSEKPQKCRFCPKRFSRKADLCAHMKVHVKEFLFHCSGCLEGFNKKGEKVEHETSCKVLRYECHLCKESFGPNKSNMIRHMRVHSGDKPFECKECLKQFTTQESALNRHKKLHAGPRSFRCSKCREGFSQQSERNVHEEKCSRQVYECDHCGKSFGLHKSLLIQHMRIHTGEKPFQCTECAKKFTQKSNLKVHMKIHARELPFECLICGQGFLKDDKRKAHQRNCNGRNYECHLCYKFFGLRKTNLVKHMLTHSGEKPFQCQLCHNAFKQKSSLTSHMNRIHHKK